MHGLALFEACQLLGRFVNQFGRRASWRVEVQGSSVFHVSLGFCLLWDYARLGCLGDWHDVCLSFYWLSVDACLGFLYQHLSAGLCFCWFWLKRCLRVCRSCTVCSLSIHMNRFINRLNSTTSQFGLFHLSPTANSRVWLFNLLIRLNPYF